MTQRVTGENPTEWGTDTEYGLLLYGIPCDLTGIHSWRSVIAFDGGAMNKDGEVGVACLAMLY